MVRKPDSFKLSIPPKLIYRFNTLNYKPSRLFWVEINKLILKVIGRCKEPRISKAIFKQSV